jgi:hypothetical protein
LGQSRLPKAGLAQVLLAAAHLSVFGFILLPPTLLLLAILADLQAQVGLWHWRHG